MADKAGTKPESSRPQSQLALIEQAALRSDIPDFNPGDTVRVRVRIREGNRERVQAFQGICIARDGGGISETVTVRKISFGVGVERVFLLNSPRIESMEVIREGHVRRAKLYYLRDLIGKRATKVKAKKYFGLGKSAPEISEPSEEDVSRPGEPRTEEDAEEGSAERISENGPEREVE